MMLHTDLLPAVKAFYQRVYSTEPNLSNLSYIVLAACPFVEGMTFELVLDLTGEKPLVIEAVDGVPGAEWYLESYDPTCRNPLAANVWLDEADPELMKEADPSTYQLAYALYADTM